MSGRLPGWVFRRRADWKSFDRTLPGAQAGRRETREELANARGKGSICDYAQLASLSEAINEGNGDKMNRVGHCTTPGAIYTRNTPGCKVNFTLVGFVLRLTLEISGQRA